MKNMINFYDALLGLIKFTFSLGIVSQIGLYLTWMSRCNGARIFMEKVYSCVRHMYTANSEQIMGELRKIGLRPNSNGQSVTWVNSNRRYDIHVVNGNVISLSCYKDIPGLEALSANECAADMTSCRATLSKAFISKDHFGYHVCFNSEFIFEGKKAFGRNIKCYLAALDDAIALHETFLSSIEASEESQGVQPTSRRIGFYHADGSIR